MRNDIAGAAPLRRGCPSCPTTASAPPPPPTRSTVSTGTGVAPARRPSASRARWSFTTAAQVSGPAQCSGAGTWRGGNQVLQQRVMVNLTGNLTYKILLHLVCFQAAAVLRHAGGEFPFKREFILFPTIHQNQLHMGAFVASLVALVVENPLASTEDVVSIHGSGRSPGRGPGNPLQYSCLENPMDRGA